MAIKQIEKSIDGVLWIQTWGRRLVGADETTEQLRVPCFKKFALQVFCRLEPSFIVAILI